MKNMELDTNKMLDGSSSKIYSSELASQDKMIIRIKKQENDIIDVVNKDSPTRHEENVSYTCEFVQKVDDTKSEEFIDICDEPIESVRQDENFIYPAITNSDDEDTSDVTWQPPSTVLIPRQRVTRKHNKCSHPKVEKPVLKKKKCKISKVKEEIVVKNLKKERSLKSKQVVEDLNVSEPDVDVDQSVETVANGSITKKVSDSFTPKVGKPRKGMATPKQRLGRIIKIHRMMK